MFTRTIIDGQFLSPWTGAGPPALTVENALPEPLAIRSATLTGRVIPHAGESPAVLIDSNSYDWADSSAAFTTLRVTPLVENLEVTDATNGKATLHGQVTHTGEETPRVILYWGDNDGKTVVAEWDHQEDLGLQSGRFSITVSDLRPEWPHYFRCYAYNSFGDSWAGSSVEFEMRITRR